MEKNKKIKVLVVPSDTTGVGKFRSINPHVKLEEYYSDEFSVDIDYQPNISDINFLKQYDIIHYHRTLGDFDNVEYVLKMCDALGIVTIMDLDDHWSPGSHHPAFLMIKESGLDKKIANNLKTARNITTTTSLFATEIKNKLGNKNVFVLPNAIDPTEKQYIPNPEKSDRIRIGWLGGSSHLSDLVLLKEMVVNLKTDKLLDKIQLVVCGFDLRGTITTIDEKTRQQTQRAIFPKESVWYKYEQIFTDNYSTISEDYKKFLLTFKQEEYSNINNEPYRRVWTKPITSYATNYNLFDIALAPVIENDFNKVKSQLKVIESGFHKKALVAQNYGPYQIDLVNAYTKPNKGEDVKFNEQGNAYLVDSGKNHKQWYQHIKKLITNPEQIEILGNNLYETVKDTYSMEAVCKTRRELYKKLYNEKQNTSIEKVMVNA